MFTADQIVAHLVGDYLLQSHWQATEKVKRHSAAAIHACFYTLPFLFITQAPLAIALILVPHFFIDRYRLARYVVWFKNYAAQTGGYHVPITATGYPDDVPPWLTVWLLIIADNTLHIICNGVAIYVAG